MSTPSPQAPGARPELPQPPSAAPPTSLPATTRDRDRIASTDDQSDHDRDQDHPHPSTHDYGHGHGHSHGSHLGSLQPRPILKSERNLSRSSAHLRWDEDTIKLHDAERGTRMKIDEPKTPWTRADHSMEQVNASADGSGGGIPPLDLLDAMDVDPEEMVPTVVKDREAGTRDEWSDDEEECDSDAHLDEEALEHKRQFEKMRAQHYNMKEALQRARWLAEHEVAHDEDEDDEADEESESDLEIKNRVPPVPALPTSFQSK